MDVVLAREGLMASCGTPDSSAGDVTDNRVVVLTGLWLVIGAEDASTSSLECRVM